MSIRVEATQKTVTTETHYRTWDISIRSEYGKDYQFVIRRELIDVDDDGRVGKPYRKDIAPSLGEPVDGADGSSKEHYPDADAGYLSELKCKISELVGRTDGITFNDRTIPLGDLPGFISAACDYLIAEKNQQNLDALFDANGVEE